MNGRSLFAPASLVLAALFLAGVAPGRLEAASGDPAPLFVVSDSSGNPLNALEPIGAEVAVYQQAIVFGTGGRDSLADQDTRQYRLFGLTLNRDGTTGELWSDDPDGNGDPYSVDLEVGEKVWSQPKIDASLNVFVTTSIGYISSAAPVDLDIASITGKLRVLSLLSGESLFTDDLGDHGGSVGGVDFNNNHTYIVNFDGTIVQYGDEDFSSPTETRNPHGILWWKKL